MIDYNAKKFSFISRALPEDTFTVVSFQGHEALSSTYEFTIRLVSSRSDIDLAAVLDAPCVFTILRKEGNIPFHGYAIEFEQRQKVNKYIFYSVRLVPKLRWLALTHHNQVFLDKGLQDMLTDVLKDGGLTSNDFSFALQGKYGKREYVCQYNETHLNFAQRWMEWAGVYYYFEQADNGEVLTITDTGIKHEPMPQGDTLHYATPQGLDWAQREERIYGFFCRRQKLPHNVMLMDYNYRTPEQQLSAEAQVAEHGLGTVYYYGDHFQSVTEGQSLAKIRSQEFQCRQTVYHGESCIPFLRPGYTFKLADHYQENENQEYLTIGMQHEGNQVGYLVAGLSLDLEAEREQQPYYRNTFSCIPAQVQFRPERLAQKPRFHGVFNAQIDASGSGTYAEVDGQGRYKVILPFDLSGRSQGRASAWMRMAQPYTGNNHGMHFPLHKQTEVLLTFIDGDPDRPIIAGAVPNPAMPSVINSANQTAGGIRSPSGGSLSFENAEGHERVVIHSGSKKSFIKIGNGSDDETIVKAENITHSIGTTGTAMVGIGKDLTSMYAAKTGTGARQFTIIQKMADAILKNVAEFGKQTAENAISYAASGDKRDLAKKLAAPKQSDYTSYADYSAAKKAYDEKMNKLAFRQKIEKKGSLDSQIQSKTDQITQNQNDIAKLQQQQAAATDPAEKQKLQKQITDLQNKNTALAQEKQNLTDLKANTDADYGNYTALQAEEKKVQYINKAVDKGIGCASTIAWIAWDAFWGIKMNKETLEEKLDKKLGRPKLLKVKTAGSDFKGYPTPSDNDPDSQTNFAINIIATDDSTLIKQATPLDGGNLKWIMANMAVGGALSGAEDGKEGDSAGEKAINAGIGVAGGAFSQTPLGAYLTRKAKKESMSPAKGISILAHESPLFLRTTFKGGTAEKHEYIYIQTPKLHIGDPKGTKNKEVNITSDNTNITSDNINLISGKITSKCEQFSVTSATDPTSGNSEEKGKLDLDKDTCALSFQKAVTQWGKECVGIASNDRISLSTVTADPEASKVLSDAKGIDKGIQLKGKDADKIKLLLGDQQVSLQKNFVQIGHNDAYTKYTNSGRITSKCTGFTVQSDKVTLGQKAQTINMGGSSSTVNIKGKTFLG